MTQHHPIPPLVEDCSIADLEVLKGLLESTQSTHDRLVRDYNKLVERHNALLEENIALKTRLESILVLRTAME